MKHPPTVADKTCMVGRAPARPTIGRGVARRWVSLSLGPPYAGMLNAVRRDGGSRWRSAHPTNSETRDHFASDGIVCFIASRNVFSSIAYPSPFVMMGQYRSTKRSIIRVACAGESLASSMAARRFLMA